MRRQTGGMGIVGLCVILLFFALNWDSMSGKEAPGFTLDRGRAVLVVFWLTSCSICRHELPLLDQLRTDFRASGVEILAVNIRDLDGAREFMSGEHLGLTNLVDANGETARKYKVSGVPKLVLIGPDGKIRRSAAGWQDEQTLRGWLADSGA